MKLVAFLRQVVQELYSVSWSSRNETLLMTIIVVAGVAVSSGVFLSVDYVLFKLLRFIYGLRF